MQLPRTQVRVIWPTLFLICIVLFGCSRPDTSSPNQAAIPDSVDFNFHVRPILSDRCFACHGPDANAREADLRLDTPGGAYAALAEQPDRHAIVPGSPDNSELIRRIFHEDPDERMPPLESNLFLTDLEREILRRWIEQGAEWKDHWAFIPPQKTAPPEHGLSGWARSELDGFVAARMEQASLQPNQAASPEKWLRRVSFDLTGLPPSIEELDAFLEDDSPEAYENVVDRLLASPHYGEHMASNWLDAARYADSHGYQDDRPRTMWPWRDWVVDAFNDNLPYDEFITWQLAGDLLPDASYEQKLATGFNRNHGITQEGGVVNEEYVTEYVADRTNTMGTAVLGMTIECARCHDHKYDPISQAEYYQLFAFFNGIDERGQISYFDLAPVPNMQMEAPELEAAIDSHAVRIARSEEESQAYTIKTAEADAWIAANAGHLDPGASLAEGLIAHYALDDLDDGYTPDALVEGRQGQINTRLFGVLDDPELVEGHAGRAFKFDGENYLDLGDIADFEHSDRFTLASWVRPEGEREEYAAILVRRNEEQRRPGYQLLLTPENKVLAGLVHDQGNERIEVQTTAALEDGDWTHIAFAYDGTARADGVTVYVDGEPQEVEVLQDSLARKSILVGNPLLVGHWHTRNIGFGPLRGFKNGAIDEVRVYDRALTPLEIATLAGRELIRERIEEEGDWQEHWRRHYFVREDTGYQAIQATLDSLRAIMMEVPNVMIMEEMEEPRPTHRLVRGAYDAPAEEVHPDTPSSILPFPDDLPRNRLGLAQWITHPQNPLTARVAANRYWQMLFGRGLVATPEDFGSQGALPSHPRLLDWLAVTYMELGWDTKALLKEIVLSATYRQDAEISPLKGGVDPSNVLLARGPNTRLSAEMLRDNALAVSGLLNDKVGGHWVKPYQPDGVWRELANQIGENKYRMSRGEDLYRRSLYTYWKRTIPPPAMITFDAAERAVCTVKRPVTSTPLQSLILLNGPEYMEASRVLAELMMTRGGEDAADRIAYGFRIATSREPTRKEMNVLRQMLKDERRRLTNAPADAAELLAIGWHPAASDLSEIELAAYTVIANTILNLDEARMRS